MERSLMPMSEPVAGGDRETVKVCNACGQEKPLSDFFGPYTDARTGQQKWKSPARRARPNERPPPQRANQV